MTDNTATLEGYTRSVMVESGMVQLFLLVKPEEDLDSRFKAWDTDNQEWLMVNGWMIEELEALAE